MKQTELRYHHIRRSYHVLTFVTSVILVAFFAWILGITLTGVSAQSSTQNTTAANNFSQDIKILPSTKEELAEGNTEAVEQVADPKITAVPGESIQQRYVLQDGEVQPIFVFHSQFPKFIGNTNVKNSTAVLDIYGNNHVTGKAIVDSNGNWKWESTVPLKPGTYSFTVKAMIGKSLKHVATDSFLFEIVLDAGQEELVMKFNNTPQLGNNGVLFDVRTVIPNESKQIDIGEPITAEIKFINFGSPNKAVDVEVQYIITDQDDKIVSENSETMAVKDQLEYNKTFLTSGSLEHGEYTLTVAVPSQDLIATATDTFMVGPEEDFAVTTATSKESPFANKTLIIEILGAMLFLGIIVGYMEYTKVVVLSKNIKQLNEADIFKKRARA